MFELIEERRSGNGGRDDVLAMLLEARHEDGSPMSDAGAPRRADDAPRRRPRDDRLLARLGVRAARPPARVLSPAGRGDRRRRRDAYLTATIQETLRRRPVLPNVEPRLVKKPIEVGGWRYPPGVCLVPNAYLVHHDPEIYADPYEFRPERFLDEPPGTYTWIPFGGGRRRCIGASFAMLEMKIVIRTLLTHCELQPARDGAEHATRRNITIRPGRGAVTALGDRRPAAVVAG